MSYDFAAVRARVSLESLLREDGIKLIGNGRRPKCLSPFQKEKTPSCSIDTQTGRFKCFSSGHSGDIFDYVMLTHGCDRKVAMNFLALKAGMNFSTNCGALPARLSTGRHPEKSEPKPLQEIPALELAIWNEGADFLRASPALQSAIGNWRGYSDKTMKALVDIGNIGLVSILEPRWLKKQDEEAGDRRVAFKVECPGRVLGSCESYNLKQVAYHVRLKPQTATGSKASWRYLPIGGVGAWPFVIGTVADASLLFVCEGQWDAISLFELLGSDIELLYDEQIAIVGMRGASSWQLLIEHYILADFQGEVESLEETVEVITATGQKRKKKVRKPLRPDLDVVMICDRDTAGDGWTTRMGEEPCFSELLQAICNEVYIREPNEIIGKDLNDLLKIAKRSLPKN